MQSFNPRTRTGCDPKLDLDDFAEFLVSIHAPARGATMALTLKGQELNAFQSTHPHGVRRAITLVLFPCALVSIHAPARGATGAGNEGATDFKVSIHAPARGATSHLLWTRETCTVSIHAPARGATRVASKRKCAQWVSIHAPARGATIHFYSILWH